MTLKHLTLKGFNTRLENWNSRRRLVALAKQVAAHAQPRPGQAPVLVFNASTRLTGLSLNAAFSLLTAWSLRLAGVPVVHFVPRHGLHPCVLGTDRQDFYAPPPCAACIAQSERLYTGADVDWFEYQPDPQLAEQLAPLGVDALSTFEYPFATGAVLPLGSLVLPAIRWALRMHHLPDDEPTRYLLRQYMLSAESLARQFAALIERTRPAAALIFNGIMYPEATAHWVARQYGLRIITHEVGFQRLSAFFTTGQATAYPLDIPDDFELSPEQNQRLDEYLEKRFQGQFTMAGIRFWPEMSGLDPAFLSFAGQFPGGIVPIFTNVVFDTSQVHANVVFPHMFAWLDLLLEVVRAHPETLFVIRAHPDEMRPDSAKHSRESVRDWVKRNGLSRLPNVIFIDSQEYISSYELIQRSRFVIVYNSSIGLEATLLGKRVLCGGKARYTQCPIVYFPQSPAAYRQQAEDFLVAESQPAPAEFQRNARRFLYYQLFRASLPLDDFLQVGQRQGFVQFKPLNWRQLLPDNAPTLRLLVDGILDQTPAAERQTFLLEEAP